MRDAVVVAVDQGTSSSKAVALDRGGAVVATSAVGIGCATPRPGWVEQDPRELLESVATCLKEVSAKVDGVVAAVGLSSQRESALAWDARTGEPLSPLLGWQDRRTAPAAARLGDAARQVRARSGLPIDPMFSALKFGWILDEIDPDRRRARAGTIRLGTVDAWLLDSLTGEFRIEAGNASRTQLLNLATLVWDDDLLDIFGVPREALPPIVRSDAPSAPVAGLGVGFTAVLGDSHAALYGHGVRAPGSVKVTYGSGSSVMGLSEGEIPAASGMVHTLGWLTDSPARAFEGNILSTGATLVWLAGIIGATPEELAAWAALAPDAGGVSLVPAFAGLGAPWWDATAQAVIAGFDQGTRREHLARAALESIPHQIEDVLQAAERATGSAIDLVLADGGPARNDLLMQLQADLSGRTVLRPENAMLSVTGAAHLAGVTAGVWDETAVQALPRQRTSFRPTLDTGSRATRRSNWAAAVRRARGEEQSS